MVYDVERAVFCAELADNVYLGATIWASKERRRASLRDSKFFTFATRANLGFYDPGRNANPEKGQKSRMGIRLLGPEFDEGDVTQDDVASVQNGYLTHTSKDMQVWLLHAEAEKVLYFVVRGTDFDAGFQDAYTDLMAFTVSTKWSGGGKVHKGVSDAWDAISELAVKTVTNALDRLDVSRLVVCGHSLGGMMATAAAFNFATKVDAVRQAKVKMSVFTYGQGVVGDSTFAAAYNAAVPVHWRHVNDRDIIPRLGTMTAIPGLLFDYKHVGTLVFLDEEKCIIGAEEGKNSWLTKGEKSDGEGGKMEALYDHSMVNYTCLMHQALATLGIPPAHVSIITKWWRAATAVPNDAAARTAAAEAVKGQKPPPGPGSWFQRADELKGAGDLENEGVEFAGDYHESIKPTFTTFAPDFEMLRSKLTAAPLNIDPIALELWPSDFALMANPRGRRLSLGAFLSSLFRLHYDPCVRRRAAHRAIAAAYSHFWDVDLDHDGVLSLEEMEAAMTKELVDVQTIKADFEKYDVDASGKADDESTCPSHADVKAKHGIILQKPQLD